MGKSQRNSFSLRSPRSRHKRLGAVPCTFRRVYLDFLFLALSMRSFAITTLCPTWLYNIPVSNFQLLGSSNLLTYHVDPFFLFWSPSFLHCESHSNYCVRFLLSSCMRRVKNIFDRNKNANCNFSLTYNFRARYSRYSRQ